MLHFLTENTKNFRNTEAVSLEPQTCRVCEIAVLLTQIADEISVGGKLNTQHRKNSFLPF
jgi:hypothetical protein